MVTEADESPRHGTSDYQRESARFWPRFSALVVAIVAVPLLFATLCDVDGRTPMNIAVDTLYDKYQIRPVTAEGDPIKDGSAAVSVSDFSLEDGATTEDVPFARHGKSVTCTVHVSDGPESVTADCTD